MPNLSAPVWSGAAFLAVSALAGPAGAASKGSASCFPTGGGSLEICRSDDEAEGSTPCRRPAASCTTSRFSVSRIPDPQGLCK
ncbi:hypothetical protein ACFQWF_21485 [Methylorubrum suomiense]